MAEYKEKNAVYALNSYVWKLVEANLGWKRYQGLIPIVPVAQQPELMQSGRAFIVYGSAFHPPGHLYQMKKEAVSYMIYAPNSTEVNRIVNLLFDTFQRQDEAAADVNDWLVEEGKHKQGGHRGVHFAIVKSTMAEKAEDAPDEEGGYAAGMVLVEMHYTEDTNDTIQTSGFTY